MKKINNLDEIKEQFALTIGNFDGFHLGHRQLIAEILEDSRKKNLKLCVMTFNPHPLKILKENLDKFLICSYENKQKFIADMGVDYYLEFPFNRDFSTTTPKEFINDFLLSQKFLVEYFAGHDFSFGANKSGDFETLKNLANGKIQINKASKFLSNEQVLSSSEIRKFLLEGSVDLANKLLGRAFSIDGIVVKGDMRGTKIGFPTANIKCENDLIVPKNGVYVTQVEYKDMTFRSLTNIGVNPTFTDANIQNVETHILDFDNDIYGEKINVSFIKKIRDERKFKDVNQLVEQIKSDVQFAKSFYEKSITDR